MKQYRNIHQDVIDKCKRGNTRAQFELYKLYYKSMYNTSFRIVNNTLEAEDIMQESFLAAFEKLSSYKGEVSFGAWLKKIVINRSLDSLKKKSNLNGFNSLDDKTFQIAEEVVEPIETEQKWKVEQIRNAMMLLPDNYRIVTSLYLLEGYDHDEISQILNVTSSTSRSQLTRAKKKLYELLNSVK